MKKLITILLTLLTFVSYGQQRMVKAEKIIFRMVNEYRVSQGLEAVVWSEDKEFKLNNQVNCNILYDLI